MSKIAKNLCKFGHLVSSKSFHFWLCSKLILSTPFCSHHLIFSAQAFINAQTDISNHHLEEVAVHVRILRENVQEAIAEAKLKTLIDDLE